MSFVGHKWVGVAFWDLNDAQAAEVFARPGASTVMAGLERPEVNVQCEACGGQWRPDFARTSCLGEANAPQGQRPPRNAPCPCGSGRKVKRCCGGGS